ncbi:unnamed protein product [Rotaria socialis]|uniref:Uncharacterized protein n=1 Tax=Rotaria socialis TaxID=392032 RepID=A0A820HGA5_9BILA|nr:unnamed protein product [Rotaria socialis]CAF4294229.1 unnamed protein product [Rotaria socialis]
MPVLASNNFQPEGDGRRKSRCETYKARATVLLAFTNFQQYNEHVNSAGYFYWHQATVPLLVRARAPRQVRPQPRARAPRQVRPQPRARAQAQAPG